MRGALGRGFTKVRRAGFAAIGEATVVSMGWMMLGGAGRWDTLGYVVAATYTAYIRRDPVKEAVPGEKDRSCGARAGDDGVLAIGRLTGARAGRRTSVVP